MKKLNCNFLFLLCILIVLVSCAKVRSGNSGGSGVSLVKIYSKGKDSLLCFGGPVSYVARNHDESLFMDYTYLKVKDESNPVKCNFSFITRDAQFRPSKVHLSIGDKEFEYGEISKFFAEGVGKHDFVYRYSFNIPDSVFYAWMLCEKPEVRINDRAFIGGRKYRKAAGLIFRKILFDLY